MLRRFASLLAPCVAIPLVVVGLASCSTSKSSDSGVADTAASADASGTTEAGAGVDTLAPTEPAAVTEAAPGDTNTLKGKTVVYLINGALGDKGFYDSGQVGIKNLETSLGVKTRTLEANFDAAKYQQLVDAAFEEGDVIFSISYGFEDLLKVAAKANPDKPVVNVDFDIADKDGNITSIDFVEEESAYLAGIAAALATTDTSLAGVNPEKRIGIVTGDTDPVTSSFVFAYENGARRVDSGMKVEKKSLGGAWDDQAKGKAAADQLFDSGNDVVFQVAAAAGLGVLQSAKDKGRYAIGVDANQNDIQPGHVIASDLKNVGGSIERVAGTIADGTFQRGQVLSFGIADGGVDLDLSATTPVLSEAIASQIDTYRKAIIDGTQVVERYKP